MDQLGYEVKLIAPRYVEPFIKRQKHDAADAEAIVEAALRPTMRFVEPRTGEQQARANVFRTREQFLNQRNERSTRCGHTCTSSATLLPRGSGICRASKTSSMVPARTCRSLPAISAANYWTRSPSSPRGSMR